MKNKYIKCSHISETKFREILRFFCFDEPASKTALYTKISRNSINQIYYKIRVKITEISTQDKLNFEEFEADKSYFGAKRVRGKRGRGAAEKTPVFGILKREGKVHISIVENCTEEQLMPIIEGKVLEGSTIHSDGWKAYDGLIINRYKYHRVYHSHNEFTREKNHINGTESFWSFAKRRLSKFNGLPNRTFNLHLKECEFRWNHRNENLYVILRKILRNNPL